MENTVRQRIAIYIQEMGITINAISKSMGYPQSNLNKQINGNTTISLPTLLVFLDYAKDISLDWLLRGKGSMLNSTPLPSDVALLQSESTVTLFEYNEAMERKIEQIGELKHEIGRLQQEVKTLRQDKKIAHEMDDVLNVAEKLKPTGTEGQ